MIKNFLNLVKHYFSRESCYKAREKDGVAVLGMCSGLAGGDATTGYLQYSCIDCNHFTPIKELTCDGCLYEDENPCIYTLACGCDKSLYLEKN